MLLDVMRYDLRLSRTLFLVNLGIFVVFLLYMAHDAAVPLREYSILAAFLFSFGGITVISREDKLRAGALLVSLPVRRDRVVVARYVLALGSGLVGVVMAAGCTLLPTARIVTEGASVASVLVPALVTLAIALSVLLPFTIRFGMMGLLVFLVTTQGLGIVALLLSRVGGDAVDMKAIIGRGVAALKDVHASVGPTASGVGVAVLLLVGLVVSCRISIGIYRRKEF